MVVCDGVGFVAIFFFRLESWLPQSVKAEQGSEVCHDTFSSIRIS
jgi:hypothetical protein